MIPDFISIYLISLSYVQESITALFLIIGQLHLYVLITSLENNRTHIENLLHGRLAATNPVQIVHNIFIHQRREDVPQVTHYILV